MFDASNIFSDLDTDFGEAQELPAKKPVGGPTTSATQFVEVCGACRGTGAWKGIRTCFACKGTGKIVHKTSPEARAKAKANYATKKAESAQVVATAVLEWKNTYVAEWRWIKSSSENGFAFAVSIRDALFKYGQLTSGQLAAVQRMVAKQEQRKQEREEKLANAPVVDVSGVQTALDTAKSNGLKKPKLRLSGFTFSLAPLTGKNAGAVYVQQNGEYLGKIMNKKFQGVFTCTPATEAEVIQVASSPAEAAIAYGRKTGSCACCGKELTNAESVERGIGPVCAEKFGF